MKYHPILFFFLSFTCCLGCSLPIFSFSPYLVFLYKKEGWIHSLWIATLCGFILDVLSNCPLGLHPIQMAVITALAYRARFYFIDKLIGLVSYAILISLIATFLSRLFLPFYSAPLPLTWKGTLSDLFCTLLYDGGYAFLVFSGTSIASKLCQQLSFLFLFLKKRIKRRENLLS